MKKYDMQLSGVSITRGSTNKLYVTINDLVKNGPISAREMDILYREYVTSPGVPSEH